MSKVIDPATEFWFRMIGRVKIMPGEKPFRFLEFEKGEVICKQGEPISGVYLLRSGKVKCYLDSGSGKKRLIHIAVQNNFLGYKAAILGRYTYTNTWVAWEDVSLFYIPARIFMEALAQNPGKAMAFCKMLGNDLHEMELNLAGLNLKPVIKRVAHALLWLDTYFQGEPIQMERAEFAQIIGTATETAIRMLATLKRQKLVDLGRSSVRIRKKKALQKLLRKN